MKTINKSEGIISKIGQRRQVVIPKKIFDSIGLKEGNFVEINQWEGRVLIKPKAVVDSDEIFSRAEEKLIERGFQELKQGQYTTWQKLKHELGL